MTLEERAREFATKAHDGQTRKYTGAPYIEHPAAVVEIVRSVPHTEAMLAGAWLHDVVEDCGVTFTQLIDMFTEYPNGYIVVTLVEQLTDISKKSDGNRKARKQIDLEHTARATAVGKTIKLADLIDNTSSIVEHDPEFAQVYLREKLALLEVLKEGDPILWQRAYDLAKREAAV